MTIQAAPDIVAIEDLNPYKDENDGKDHFTHIVRPFDNKHIDAPGMTSADIVSVARFMGLEVFALCGYRFIPERNPEKYPACDACIAKANEIYRGESM